MQSDGASEIGASGPLSSLWLRLPRRVGRWFCRRRRAGELQCKQVPGPGVLARGCRASFLLVILFLRLPPLPPLPSLPPLPPSLICAPCCHRVGHGFLLSLPPNLWWLRASGRPAAQLRASRRSAAQLRVRVPSRGVYLPASIPNQWTWSFPPKKKKIEKKRENKCEKKRGITGVRGTLYSVPFISLRRPPPKVSA